MNEWKYHCVLLSMQHVANDQSMVTSTFTTLQKEKVNTSINRHTWHRHGRRPLTWPYHYHVLVLGENMKKHK